MIFNKLTQHSQQDVVKDYKITKKNYTIISTILEKNGEYEKVLKVGFMMELIINNTKTFSILTYDEKNKFDIIDYNTIAKYKIAAYVSLTQKILNTQYKKHPFFNELKSNAINTNKYLLKFSKPKIDSKNLQQIFIDNVPKEAFKKLETYYDQVFNKKQFPHELNQYGRNLDIKESNNIIEFMDKYAFGHRQLMLFGEKGTGKTYNIRKFVDKNNWKLVKIDGHAGLDEYSLLGHLIKNYEGNFVWKNGSLAEAFREASNGERVVVFIDEILRMNPQTLNLLITAMDPYNGYYELELDNPTEVIKGTVKTETLKAPVQNLWFVCATNIGADYEVTTMDEAFKDRFILKEISISKDEMKTIVSKKLEEKNFNYPIDKLMNFYAKIHNLYLSNSISHDINLRHITDVLEYAIEIDDIKILFRDKIFAWAGLDYNGKPIYEEKTIINQAIDSIL